MSNAATAATAVLMVALLLVDPARGWQNPESTEAPYNFASSVPVQSQCNIISYKMNSILLISVQITEKTSALHTYYDCAKDVASMVDTNIDKVFITGFNPSFDIDSALEKKSLLYCNLTKIEGFTDLDNYRVYMSIPELSHELKRRVSTGDFEGARTVSKTLSEHNGDVLKLIVNKLIKKQPHNIMLFAYVLWKNEAANIVIDYFPKQFQLLFNEQFVSISDHQFEQALTLDSQQRSNGDRLAKGHAFDRDNQKIVWKLTAFAHVSDGKIKTVLFKIRHVYYDMCLDLVNTINRGDREAFGESDCEHLSNEWIFKPQWIDDELTFYIHNVQYRQALKLEFIINIHGDRYLVGHGDLSHPYGSELLHEGRYRWIIKPL